MCLARWEGQTFSWTASLLILRLQLKWNAVAHGNCETQMCWLCIVLCDKAGLTRVCFCLCTCDYSQTSAWYIRRYLIVPSSVCNAIMLHERLTKRCPCDKNLFDTFITVTSKYVVYKSRRDFVVSHILNRTRFNETNGMNQIWKNWGPYPSIRCHLCYM